MRQFRFVVGILFVFLMASALSTAAWAQYGDEAVAGFQRGWRLSFCGGFAQTESYGSVPEVTAELQFRITPRVYASVSVGYLGETISDYGGHRQSGTPMGFEDHLRRFQVVPIMLNVYYSVPVSPRVAAYVNAAAGYFAATYWDLSTQSQGDFGGHAGAGLNFRPSGRMEFFVAGTYRTARIGGFVQDVPPGSLPSPDGPQDFSIGLDGFRMQFGMRFRF